MLKKEMDEKIRRMGRENWEVILFNYVIKKLSNHLTLTEALVYHSSIPTAHSSHTGIYPDE
ncbi:MAG: hypothetical protein P8Z35_11440 [Ignavibacteriaceae bacterium]